uniref:Uncharacterized protein n=1 Tax=viral metagenome TaxID=1070528 RepID=A0A6M3XRX6_9ZZZZ
MTMRQAKYMFQEFHLKDPHSIIKLRTSIPKLLYPIGYAIQISYKSNKWNKDENNWMDYIHWWENETLICIPERMIDEIVHPRDRSITRQTPIDLGPNRNEVTFLGHCIDFNISNEDRSGLDLDEGFEFNEKFDSEDVESMEKLQDSVCFEFLEDPGIVRGKPIMKSYVVCSPNGKIVYVIDDDTGEIYAFMNEKCRVTKHGITG